MQLSHVLQSIRRLIWDVRVGYLVFQNLFIFSEGEHLYREAFDVGWDRNPGIAHDRMEEGHIAVITVLTAKQRIKLVFLNALLQHLNL